MFHLESSISEWRQQMLVAGISPSELDELESHLREEIEQQMKSGMDRQAAFESAVQKIGRSRQLTAEFKRAGGFVDWLGDTTSARTDRILALLWLVYCTGSFFSHGAWVLWPTTFQSTAIFVLAVVFEAIYLRGIIAAILLFGRIRRVQERRIVWLIAIMDAVGGIGAMATLHLHLLTVAFTILGIISVWLLRPSMKLKSAGS
jgi:hypothetical protein